MPHQQAVAGGSASSDAIYAQSIVIRLETSDDGWTFPVTELDRLEEWDRATDLNLKIRKGPGEGSKHGDILKHHRACTSDSPEDSVLVRS